MYAVKAIYDGKTFKPIQPIPVKERYEVVITFLEPVTETAGESAIDVTQVKKRPCSEVIGKLKGKVWMSDDFNEPLDELREYME